MISQLDQAVYDTAHHYSEGAKALADRIGMRPSTLYNKVDPGIDTHHLSVTEALALMLASDDYRILNALADRCGFDLVARGRVVHDQSILDMVCQIAESEGTVAEQVRQALADGQLSANELGRINTAVLDAVAALQNLTRTLNGG